MDQVENTISFYSMDSVSVFLSHTHTFCYLSLVSSSCFCMCRWLLFKDNSHFLCFKVIFALQLCDCRDHTSFPWHFTVELHRGLLQTQELQFCSSSAEDDLLWRNSMGALTSAFCICSQDLEADALGHLKQNRSDWQGFTIWLTNSMNDSHSCPWCAHLGLCYFN